MQQTTLCINCLGCNKLEDPNFKGKKDCENFKDVYFIEKYYQTNINLLKKIRRNENESK